MPQADSDPTRQMPSSEPATAAKAIDSGVSATA